MSTQAHTPGPWEFDGNCGGYISQGGDRIARAYAASDARFIAAAPDLESLADLVTVYQIEGDDAIHLNVCGVKIGAFGPSTGKAIALLRYEAERRAAIAKTEGRS